MGTAQRWLVNELNVLAVLPATVHKDQDIIISAQYDTIAFANQPAKPLEERIAALVKDGMSEAEVRKHLPTTGGPRPCWNWPA